MGTPWYYYLLFTIFIDLSKNSKPCQPIDEEYIKSLNQTYMSKEFAKKFERWVTKPKQDPKSGNSLIGKKKAIK